MAPEAPENDDTSAPSAAEAAVTAQEAEAAADARPRARSGLILRAGLAAAVVAICGLLAASGYLTWQHRSLTQVSAQHAEYAAIARQGVVNLMTLDYANAAENVQSIIDSATGDFKEEFEAQADMLIESLAQSEVRTEVTVNSVAVEPDSDQAPVVLVAATSQAANAEDARREPQRFRVAVTLADDGGEFKIAQVEFV
ncbi:hypothetical protein [[Mycobacterium] wendilense]|uniref:Mce protein n=1 Tax=[Mycobacterium] wendilense TaxID=3064284 RepID=A0ABN9P0E1_9MYCO|nr:hypothetical protein [Mycolicibacterium sp. MU0050]CAJ1581282.1 hypothetical protein MU0050_001479 [Mycolicibacterium sp. MU0050]